MERVIELRSKTNTNPGHMVFKCPRNNPCVSICSTLILVGCHHRLDLVFLSAFVVLFPLILYRSDRDASFMNGNETI